MLHFGKLGVYLKPATEPLVLLEIFFSREFGLVHNPAEGRVEEDAVRVSGRPGVF